MFLLNNSDDFISFLQRFKKLGITLKPNFHGIRNRHLLCYMYVHRPLIACFENNPESQYFAKGRKQIL